MPVCLDSDLSSHGLFKRASYLRGKSPDRFTDSGAASIEIGLINNMPDSALRATERQFVTLLDAAAGGLMVRLWFYSLPEVPRAGDGRDDVNSLYSGIE